MSSPITLNHLSMLRHYKQEKAKANMSETEATFYKTTQFPTAEGIVALEHMAIHLPTHGTTPNIIVVSPQPRASSAGVILRMTREWKDTAMHMLDAIGDTSSDPEARAWLAELKEFCQQENIDISTGVLTWPIARDYTFGRSQKALATLGQLALDEVPDGGSVVGISHGGLIEMMCLQLQLVRDSAIPPAEQTLNLMDIDALDGGVLACSEGIKFSDLQIDDEGVIVEVGNIEMLRLPAEFREL